MKKSLLLTLTFLCNVPFLSFAQQPASNPGIIVKTSDASQDQSFILRLANLQKKPVRVLIQDNEGNTYLSDKITNHNGYRMLVDMRNLSAGNYILHILHPAESMQATLEVTPDDIEVNWKTDERIGMQVDL